MSAPRRSVDDITERRARAAWEERADTLTPMTGTELGALLGMTPQGARKVAKRWRDERAASAVRTEAAR